MKKLLLILIICISSISLGQQANFEWAKAFGSSSYDYGNSMKVDASGNVYTTGSFWGTVDFDPGAGTFNLTPAGNSDIFIQKLDASGNFLWVKSFGSTGTDYGKSIAVDASGNVYTTGSFFGTVDFDPGAGTFNLTTTYNDVFIQKLDASGNFLWAKSFGGTGNNIDSGNSIAVDASGNVYTTGYFEGTADFDPGAGTFNLSSAGGQDVFVQKLDASGNFLWAKAFGGGNNYDDYGLSIAVDTSGNVYTTGSFYLTVDFDPEAGTFNLTSVGGRDIFIQKLDASGNFLWAKAFGGNNDEYGNSMKVDASGNIFTTGSFWGTVDFDPGAGALNLTSAGNRDIFIQKLDTSGDFIWAKAFGSNNDDRGFYITVDTSGNVYTTGQFEGTTDFDPGAGTLNLTSAGNRDIFIQKLDASGDFLWAKAFGSSNDDRGYCITVDASENVYTTGMFEGTADFDPGAGTFNLTSTGNSDVFVHKISLCMANTGIDLQTACDSYQWIDGQTYTASNNSATVTLTNAAGCDSIVTLNLTINNSNTGSETVTECDSYTWNTNGQTYTQSGQYTEILSNQSGCDSTVTLDLTINTSSSSTQTETGIDSYTWPVNNQTYNQSGTYTAVIPNASGCDSTITLELTLQFTGLDENKSSYVAVYPNPTYNSFTLSTKDMINMNYSLVDIHGKVFFTGKIESSEEMVNTSKLSNGQYKLVFENQSIPAISVIKK